MAAVGLKVGIGAMREPGLYLAVERGYFRAAGVEIEILQMPSTMGAHSQLYSGRIDVLLSGLGVQFLNAVAQGSPVRMVAARDVISKNCGNLGRIYALRKK